MLSARGIGFGGDYNPEQWDAATWAEDDALMREARVTTATVGVFSWACLEPEEGRYDFGWLDETLGRLHANGVRVNLATPTASPPPWFSLAHPEALPVTAEGTRLWHGSRDTYCAAAPAYREAALRIAGKLARRYAGHPAVALWHVHNEYGTICWCGQAADAFRRWLRDRYGGLAELNDAWCTAFWSQRYSAWEQVLPPRTTQYLPNPGQVLDFRRFWSDVLLAAYREQRDEIRRHAPGVPVTTNHMLPDHQLLDLWAWSRETDVVAIDHYPGSPDATEGHAQIAFAADLARSLNGGGPWMLMEQAVSTVNSGGRLLHREPGRTLADSLAYVARGADDVLFFQWRASRGGAELYHAALVPHAGPDSRIFREAAGLGRALERLREVAGSRVRRAAAAILLDPDSWWALETAARSLPSPDIGYAARLRAAHQSLWRCGIGCEFASPEADLSGYRLVVAPVTYILSDRAAASLRAFARGGGQLVVSFLTGVADPRHQVRQGGYPGALRDVLGIRAEEFHPLPPGTSVPLDDGTSGSLWSERLRREGAGVLASYAEGALAGLPALTRNDFGDGAAWYASTCLDAAGEDRLIRLAAEAAGVSPELPGLPPGVDVVRRHAGDGRSWLFAFSHAQVPVTLPVTGISLLTGGETAGRLTLAPGSVAVIRE